MGVDLADKNPEYIVFELVAVNMKRNRKNQRCSSCRTVGFLSENKSEAFFYYFRAFSCREKSMYAVGNNVSFEATSSSSEYLKPIENAFVTGMM